MVFVSYPLMGTILKNLSLAAALLTAAASLVGSRELPAGAPGTGDISAQELLATALDQGKDSKTRCAAIKELNPNRDEAVLLALAGAIQDPDSGVRVCAALAAGEMKNGPAVDMLRANIETYMNSGHAGKDEVNARLAAINSIWSLGEIGGAAAAGGLMKLYRAQDDTLKINNIISLGKQQGDPGALPFIKGVAASPQETETVRAAAFEMLEEMGQDPAIPGLAPSMSAGIADGDLLFAGGLTGDITEWVSPDLPLGHAGIFEGAETRNGRIYVLIGDCVPNFFKPGGVRNISAWKNFTHKFKYPYYGNMTVNPAPTPAQRREIVGLAVEMGKKGLTYDITHISQKGPVKFDCVGYTEYIYEAVGLNPTDNSYETGLGWPLTPWEQFSGLVPSTAPTPPHTGASLYRAAPAGDVLEKGLFGPGGEYPDFGTFIKTVLK